MSERVHPGVRLREAMGRGVVAAPGAFNGLCARAVMRAGFEACYVSGAATSVCAGVPDVGLLTLEHFTRTVREVADGSGLPVLADADTGFGEAEMVRRTVVEYERAGGAGLHLEDQVFPKRCGHLDGKALVPMDHMCEKVEWAAKASRDCSGGAFIVCARTDARGVEGLEAAVARAKAYVQAGAEMIFPEGLTSEAEFAAFARGVRSSGSKPFLLANMTEFGKTPMIPLARFGEMGYDVVIYPVTLLRVAMGAVTRALVTLGREGSAESLLGEMQTRQELYGLIGYEPGKPWEWPVR
ncbi:MAG TPA: isocitrate lyase/phosphoenolpyruvate mutase family protein [Phycisphaerales bacterium]|nr:isocitrate lyase/phosphoenolpyruvate mutase family protein [Phycisphaerales bacterium]